MTKLPRPSQAELDRMSQAEKDALILKLFDRLEGYERRLSELEQKIEKTSRNSSQPPSADGLKRPAGEPRTRGDKPNGGHPGHRGITRAWVETPDEVVELQPVGTCNCGAVLAGLQGLVGERRQQIEIPEPKVIVTQYRQVVVTCSCGRVHRGEFPVGVTPYVSYGPRLKAYAVGLVQGHLVALTRTAEMLADQYGVRPSDGTVQNWGQRAAVALQPTYEASRQALVASAVVHFDESGVRVNGQTHWLHVAGTADHAFYTIHPKRGQEAMEAAGILPQFTGQAVHDHWKPYWGYDAVTHNLCNAHHLRELRYFEEATGHYWPISLRPVLVEGKCKVQAAQAEGKTALDTDQVESLLARYDTLVANGLKVFPERPPTPGRQGRPKQEPAPNLLIRLRAFKNEVWRFLTDWRVPFDNNLAERLVRPVKVKLKVAGGFRALGGCEAFCIIRSVWETNKRQSINPFHTLRLAFEGAK